MADENEPSADRIAGAIVYLSPELRVLQVHSVLALLSLWLFKQLIMRLRVENNNKKRKKKSMIAPEPES